MEFLVSEASRRRTLYVGGLDKEVTNDILQAAFIPFGPINDVHVAKNYQTQISKGFGFVEFVDEDDAKEAIDNMNESELFGWTLTVTIAKMTPKRI